MFTPKNLEVNNTMHRRLFLYISFNFVLLTIHRSQRRVKFIKTCISR